MSNLERSIVHMDLDTFFVSCERLIYQTRNDSKIPANFLQHS